VGVNPSANNRPERLVFVYDADGTLAGELKYYFGSLIGRAHCSLCDVTHTKVGRRRAFQLCVEQLPTTIDYFHRNDVPDDVRAVTNDRWPAVVGRYQGGEVRVLLNRDELNGIDGDVDRFSKALHARMD
jgi:hypothetical protein